MNFPTCDFEFVAPARLYSLMRVAISREKPFSFIRLGDGEGVLLSLGDQPKPYEIEYLTRHLGEAATDRAVCMRLRDLVYESIASADVIGIRDDIIGVDFDLGAFVSESEAFLESFRCRFKLRRPEEHLNAEGARRVALLHMVLSQIEFGRGQEFCSAWMHYKLYSRGLLLRLLRRQNRIGVISCRAELPHLLSELLGLEVAFYPIPDMYRNIGARGEVHGYLDRLEHLLAEPLVEFPGMLFLVGGGFYGKAYCHRIKALGGIALDAGSLLDAWVGIPSRPTVYEAEYRDTPRCNGVPTTLLLDDAGVKRAERCELIEPAR